MWWLGFHAGGSGENSAAGTTARFGPNSAKTGDQHLPHRCLTTALLVCVVTVTVPSVPSADCSETASRENSTLAIIGAPDSVRQILQWHMEVPMGSAPGVMSMLTLPQKHVAAEGGAAEDILAQPLRSSLPATVERAWLRTRELAGRPACAGAAEFSSADETESESSMREGQGGYTDQRGSGFRNPWLTYLQIVTRFARLPPSHPASHATAPC